jgi:hypothetical protein
MTEAGGGGEIGFSRLGLPGARNFVNSFFRDFSRLSRAEFLNCLSPATGVI